MKKTNSIKKLLTLGVILVLVLSMAMSISASAKTVSEAKNSVVVVMGPNGYGSGFAIGKVGKPVEYIVTNNHVVEADTGAKQAQVVFDLASNEFMIADIYLYNAEKDIAVLKLPKPTDLREPLVICPSEHVNIDDNFAALGYPADQVTDWPKYNTSDITVTKGGMKKPDRVMGMDVYMLDLTITHGNSGGPLVNSAGEVVGINSFGIGNNNYAISIDELLALDGFDKIVVSMHGEVNNNLILFIIIGAALLLIIVLVIVLVVVRNGKKNNAPVAPAPAPADNNMYAADNGMNNAGYAPVPPVAPAAPSARLVAVSGVLQGKRFSVSGAVKIGRDASKCALSFPVNTQGVSGVHCEVSFDGTVCYVKDLNSSYGTFTMDGRRLAPNAPQFLKSGDKFYLASPENTFEVRF